MLKDKFEVTDIRIQDFPHFNVPMFVCSIKLGVSNLVFLINVAVSNLVMIFITIQWLVLVWVLV